MLTYGERVLSGHGSIEDRGGRLLVHSWPSSGVIRAEQVVRRLDHGNGRTLMDGNALRDRLAETLDGHEVRCQHCCNYVEPCRHCDAEAMLSEFVVSREYPDPAPQDGSGGRWVLRTLAEVAP
jgi:hypothetical protein